MLRSGAGVANTMKNIDAVIYTPLEEEFSALRVRFKPTLNIDGDNYTGYEGVGPEGKTVAVVLGFDWGNDQANLVMTEILGRYIPKMAICIGIGGGITKDAKLGDVFYSSHVLDLTQRMKFEKDKKGINRTRYDPDPYESSANLKKVLDRSRLSSVGLSTYKKWVSDCELVNQGLLAGHNTKNLGHPSSYFVTPTGKAGKIASTNAVLADENAVEDVRACGRKMVCVDTEGAGFARACATQGLRQHVVIRGISDMADETKKIAEEEFKNVFRLIAASNAVLFLYNNFVAMLKNIKTESPGFTPTATTNVSADVLAIEANEKDIKEELTRRSVAFKMIEQDHRMPVPRIRNNEPNLDNTGGKKSMPEQEIEDALDQNNRILIKLPKHYPDTALPWLFANLLTEPNSGGLYPIPVCIKWSDYGPPRNTLDAHLEEKGLLFAKNNSSYRIIFVVLDALIGLKNKPQFLAKDFETYNNADIILFHDRNEVGNLEDEMSRNFQTKTYGVEGISFSSITNYVKANFGMSMDESEALAIRLVSTFNNFRIKVHPTYLASIQKDTVLSFIEANQRGELIELAVAGLLSLLVADDKAKVVLRRGTRERFLSRLAVSIYSDKEKYDESQINSYVASYAKEMGFDIEPKQFIKSFVDNGILSYEGGYVEISVPVIRSYMLAKGLASQGMKGMQYFDLSSNPLDISTFDLYCEFNDDKNVYDIVEVELDKAIKFFSDKISTYSDTIVDGQFRSHLLAKSANMAKFSEDISRIADDLVTATNLVSEKQAKLDVQLGIAQSEAAKSVDLSDSNKFKDEHASVVCYMAAAIMLGSAAEKMTDEVKLSIISKLMRLSSLISTDLLTVYSRLDVDSTIKEVMSQVEENKTVIFDTPEARAEFRDFVELNVGMWQLDLASYPLGWLLSVLCESGRTNVLLSPIERAKANDKLEEFFQAIWAFDLDPVAKRRLPKELSKRLGHSPFLRTLFGMTMVNRSYWYHHGRPRKEAVARGIDEVLKTLSLKSSIDLDDAAVP